MAPMVLDHLAIATVLDHLAIAVVPMVPAIAVVPMVPAIAVVPMVPVRGEAPHPRKQRLLTPLMTLAEVEQTLPMRTKTEAHTKTTTPLGSPSQ